ncbi:uncharacterized protein LOC130135302 [Syzygium oleosum]|uniref:uncharacterized protein LOC130135302 n=1 Tax=Syzygium oleosum TaxID=219896 RepID=UPI0024B9304F|nr:uncharacterized protein LOC130135302 [Syzygium oleosum]
MRKDIRKQLVPFNLKNYDELYERAQLVEQELLKERAEMGQQSRSNLQGTNDRRDKRPFQFGRHPFTPNKRRNFVNFGVGNNQSLYREQPLNELCRQCGKAHGNLPCMASKISFVSALEAYQLLEKGAQGHLAVVKDQSKKEVKLEEVLVIRDFSDVFPEESPGLPPKREIEFVNELAPGTEPISKAPYHMAPAELKELKVQLQELLDKGFIRPSSSPWGAHVLFVKKKDGSLRLCIDYR